ncbi:MAG: type II toxin-antitoxin system RnlB family antitoxin [Nannocystis sp.]|nr:type II toxin-antitoxin system RnlB family antitoxin [Nannocystis sp.]
MNCQYCLGRLDDATCIVWSVSYISPTEFLEEIARALADWAYSGGVVFDLLLANGQASNRFVGARFDGRDFDRASFVVISQNLDTLKHVSLRFYHSHPEMLENSVLPKTTQFLIRKNICV